MAWIVPFVAGLFGEQATLPRPLCIGLIVAGILGLGSSPGSEARGRGNRFFLSMDSWAS